MHLDRMMSVLEAVALAGRPVTVSEIMVATGLPRPTCYRLVQTLAEHRLLEEPGAAPGYQIGARLRRIGVLGRSDVDICQVVAPALKETAIAFGEAVFLSRVRDSTVEIIHVETPADATRSFIHPGLGNRPIHACSCSKAIAAFADRAFLQTVLSGRLRSYTDRTKTVPQEIEAEFADIRTRGYAECVEEIEVGVSSVAAPVRIGALGVPFSVGATGPIRRFTDRHRQDIGAGLIQVAGQIAETLQLAGTGR